MAWIELHQSLWTHRKTLELAERLSLPELYAAAHMIALWTWALDNAPDGVLSVTERVLAKACQWPGPSKELATALVESGFLEEGPVGWVIHDWWNYAGKLVEARRKNAERQKRYRERQQPDDVTEQARNDNVTRMSPLRNTATQPNPCVL